MSIATISYGGSTIATINEDAEINLETQSKYMTDDVTVVVDYPEVWDGSYTSGGGVITDLTGTRWELSNPLNTCPAGYGQFQVHISIDQATYNGFFVGYGIIVDPFSPQPPMLGPASGYVSSNSGYLQIAMAYEVLDPTITFDYGTDATNADLISWLQANATQIS